LFTVTAGNAKVGVALGPGVSVRVGVRVIVGVRLGIMVSVGGIVSVTVSVGNVVSVAEAGIAVEVAVGANRDGELQARATMTGTRKNKLDFRMPLFYNRLQAFILVS
jgi:hypothetical protein